MYEHNTKIFADRFRSFGCNTLEIDGHSIGDLVEALSNAEKNKNSPTAIVCRTEKGKHFTDEIEGKQNWHGKDLGAKTEEVVAHLKSLIKIENIEFKTFEPAKSEGDFIQPERGAVSVKPNY